MLLVIFFKWLKPFLNVSLIIQPYNNEQPNNFNWNYPMRVYKPIQAGAILIPARDLLAADTGVHSKILSVCTDILGEERAAAKHKGGFIAFLSVKKAALVLHDIYLDETSPSYQTLKRKPKPFYVKDKTAKTGPAAAHILTSSEHVLQLQKEMNAQLQADITELDTLLSQLALLKELTGDLIKSATLITQIQTLNKTNIDSLNFITKLASSEFNSWSDEYSTDEKDEIKKAAHNLLQHKTDGTQITHLIDLAQTISKFTEDEVFEIKETLTQQLKEKQSEIENPSFFTQVPLSYPLKQLKYLAQIEALKIKKIGINNTQAHIMLEHQEENKNQPTNTIAIVNFSNKIPNRDELLKYLEDQLNSTLDHAHVDIKIFTKPDDPNCNLSDYTTSDYYVLGENEKIPTLSEEESDKGKAPADTSAKTFFTYAYMTDADPFAEGELEPKKRAKTPRDTKTPGEQLRAMQAMKWQSSTLSLSTGSILKLLTSKVGIGNVILRHIKLLRDFNKGLAKARKANNTATTPAKPLPAPPTRARRGSLVLEQLRVNKLSKAPPIAGIHGFTCSYNPENTDSIIEYIKTDNYLHFLNKPKNTFPLIDEDTKISVIISPPYPPSIQPTGESSTATKKTNDHFVHLSLEGRDSILTFLLVMKLARYDMHLNRIWAAQIKRLSAHIDPNKRIDEIKEYAKLGVITAEQERYLILTTKHKPGQTTPSPGSSPKSGSSGDSSENESEDDTTPRSSNPLAFFTPEVSRTVTEVVIIAESDQRPPSSSSDSPDTDNEAAELLSRSIAITEDDDQKKTPPNRSGCCSIS